MDRILISVVYILLIFIMSIDINKKIIPNYLNILIFFIAILYSAFKEPIEFFVAISTYSFPLVILYGYLSDFLKKEVIGFGDIKLVISLAAFMYQKNINLLLQIYIFYLIVFGSASIFLLFLFIYKKIVSKNFNLKNSQIAFAPFIIFSFVIILNFNTYIWEYIL